MTRRGIFGALLLGSGGAALAAPPRLAVPEVSPVEEVQHRGRGRRRCWWETRQVRYRDSWGRVRWRTVRRQVCNF